MLRYLLPSLRSPSSILSQRYIGLFRIGAFQRSMQSYSSQPKQFVDESKDGDSQEGKAFVLRNIEDGNHNIRRLLREHPHQELTDQLELIKKANIHPNIETYNLVIQSCHRDPERGLQLLEEIKKDGITPDVSTYATLLEALRQLSKWNLILPLFKSMSADGILLPQVAYDKLLGDLFLQDQDKFADELWQALTLRPLEWNGRTLDIRRSQFNVVKAALRDKFKEITADNAEDLTIICNPSRTAVLDPIQLKVIHFFDHFSPPLRLSTNSINTNQLVIPKHELEDWRKRGGDITPSC